MYTSTFKSEYLVLCKILTDTGVKMLSIKDTHPTDTKDLCPPLTSNLGSKWLVISPATGVLSTHLTEALRFYFKLCCRFFRHLAPAIRHNIPRFIPIKTFNAQWSLLPLLPPLVPELCKYPGLLPGQTGRCTQRGCLTEPEHWNQNHQNHHY